WTRQRSRTEPVTLDLTCTDPPAITWLPGERDAALAGWAVTDPYCKVQTSWEQAVADFTAGTLDWRRHNALFVDGPYELVAPLVRAWRPAKVPEAPGSIRRIVARFEVDVLPAALGVARAQPNATAVLLPYSAPEVAEFMADLLTRV